MISRNLMRSFRATFTVATSLGVVPFDYLRKERKLRVSTAAYKYIVPNLVTLVFLIRAVYILFELIRSGQDLSENNIREFCLMGLQVVIFWDNAFFMYNCWKNRHAISWIFNQISDAEQDTTLPRKSKLTDKVMLMWTPGHFNIFLQLFTDFIKHPHGKQHIFSMFSGGTDNAASVFHLFLAYEAFTLFAFVWSALFEFSCQVFFLKSLINLTAKISQRKISSDCDFTAAIRSFRSSALVLRNFNAVYGFSIEQIKTSFTIFCVVCNYVMIKHHSTLPPNLIGFLVDCILFCHTLPPLLYHECYKLEENSENLQKILTSSLNNIHNVHSRRICLREIHTIKPLRVKVGGVYYLDRMMTPTYLFIVFNYTLSVLLFQ